MKAIQLEHRGPTGPRLVDIAPPPGGPGLARLRMLAASVNRVDLYMRDSGAGITHDLPLIMGVDGVGEVIEAPGFAPGDQVILYPYVVCGRCRYCLAGDQPLCLQARIFGEHRDGTFAEEIAVPVETLVPLAADADPLAAAALGVAGLTAWRMVFGKAPAGPGTTVFIQGAGGGVALAALQLARMAGARVIASSTGAAKIARLAGLGAEVIDYAAGDVAKAVLDLTGGEGADLVIDNVGERTWPGSLRAAARGGHIVTCGATTGAHPSADIQRLFVRQLSVHGSTMGNRAEFRRLIRCFEAGAYAPVIDSIHPLAEVPRAFDRLGAADRFGKIIISIR